MERENADMSGRGRNELGTPGTARCGFDSASAWSAQRGRMADVTRRRSLSLAELAADASRAERERHPEGSNKGQGCAAPDEYLYLRDGHPSFAWVPFLSRGRKLMTKPTSGTAESTGGHRPPSQATEALRARLLKMILHNEASRKLKRIAALAH
jgi:hypothetical protein